MLRKLGLGLLLITASPAIADQCAWISEPQAKAAVKILAKGDRYIDYCELCDGAVPVEKRITDVRYHLVQESPRYFEVLVNGGGVDLAYAFVPTPEARKYRNLAQLAGCPATGVSDVITHPAFH